MNSIPLDKQKNLYVLAFYCHEHPEVLAENKATLDAVCQFLFPRIDFPCTLKNRDELMEHIGLGEDAHIGEIQADPSKCLKVIVAYATCHWSKWGASEQGSACSGWPIEITSARMLARVIAKVAAE